MGACSGDFLAISAMREPRAKREFVDFAAVPEAHWSMHERLLNWARASRDLPRVAVSAGFDLYRSSDARREYGTETATVVDQRDAAKIGFGVVGLPEAVHRPAIQWYYLKRGDNPGKQARVLGLTLQSLADHVREARQMLINRRV
jgi:hypothetical protein